MCADVVLLVCRFQDLVTFWRERQPELKDWIKLVIKTVESRCDGVAVDIHVTKHGCQEFGVWGLAFRS
jgi:hypothetical protein